MNVRANAGADFVHMDDAEVAGFQRLTARFHGHAYDPHRHESYAIGRTLSGAQAFRYRGAQRLSRRGECMVIHPDETHDGHAPQPAGFTYQMIYVEPWLLRKALASGDLPFVPGVVAEDHELFRLLEEIFSTFPDPLMPLEHDGHLAKLADLMLRRASGKITCRRFLPEREVDTGRAFLDEEFHRPIDSAALEEVTGLDRFEFARAFRNATGTSPHRYLVGRRLAEARQDILQGAELADVAYSVGFSDQSHMTRHFKARYGITPGRLAALAVRGTR